MAKAIEAETARREAEHNEAKCTRPGARTCLAAAD